MNTFLFPDLDHNNGIIQGRSFLIPTIITLCIFCLTAGFVLTAFPGVVAVNFLYPLAERFFSPDHHIDPGTIDLLTKLLATIGIALESAGLFLACFAFSARRAQGAFPDEILTPETTPVSQRKDIFILTAIILLAVLHWIPLINRGFFFDELRIVTGPLEHPSLTQWFSMQLGSVILSFGMFKLMGPLEWSLRIPSMIMGLLCIYAIYSFMRKNFTSRSGLIAAFLLAVSPVLAIWSTSARGYSGYTLFTIISCALYFDCLKEKRFPPRSTLLLLFFTNLIGLSFHIYFIFIVFTEIILLIALPFIHQRYTPAVCTRSTYQRLALTLITPLTIAALLFIPITMRLWFKHGIQQGTAPLQNAFPVILIKDLLSIPLIPLGLIALGVIITGGILWRMRLIAGFTMILLLFILLVWLMKPAYLCSRYWAPLLPLLIILMSAGADALAEHQKPFKNAGRVICAVFLITILFVWITMPSKLVRECYGTFRETGALAQKAASPSTRFCAIGEGNALFGFYAGRPVKIIQNMEEFLLWRKENPEYLCFIIPGLATPDGRNNYYEENKLIAELRNDASEEHVGEISVFLKTTPPPKRTIQTH